MAYVVDTNVLSELARPQPHPGVVRWMAARRTLRVSAVTVEEIHAGLAWRSVPAVERAMGRLLRRAVVLPVTAEVAELAGKLRGQLRASGETRTQADMLIAATARVAGLGVATRNVGDFEGCGVEVFDPWHED